MKGEIILTAASLQGSHTLEKYLNIQDCLEKTMEIIFALETTGNT